MTEDVNASASPSPGPDGGNGNGKRPGEPILSLSKLSVRATSPLRRWKVCSQSPVRNSHGCRKTCRSENRRISVALTRRTR